MLPQQRIRIFRSELQVGPFKGEKIDRQEFEALKQRFYQVTDLNEEGLPRVDWHRQLSESVTVRVTWNNPGLAYR